MKDSVIDQLILALFNEHLDKIIDPTYYPKSPIETLVTRLTAVWLLENDDMNLVETAESFIRRTSTAIEEDLVRLRDFSALITCWHKFEICSIYTNHSGLFVEYKLKTTDRDDNEQTAHYHAIFQMDDDRCIFVSQFSPLIRIIGDPTLHKPGSIFPINPTSEERQELAAQIEYAKSVLIKTSGAGIAANQCAEITKPYQFTIVGIFHDIQEHVAGVARRYPGTIFPPARIMVNPIVIKSSVLTQNFNHSCLSVPTPNRCCITSPEQITVTYQDAMNDLASTTLTLTGIDAVVLWHELNHILDGKTYIDTAFESLTPDDLVAMKEMLTAEKEKRDVGNGNITHCAIPELTVPPFHFTVKMDRDNIPKLDLAELADVLPKMTSETLEGLLTRCIDLCPEPGPAYLFR